MWVKCYKRGHKKLTLDCMQHTTVQWLTAGVIGGGTDAGSTAVGQSAPVCHL